MHAKDIMSQPAHTVRTDEPVGHAVALLEQAQITSAPVVDERGTLVGSISEFDLLRRRGTVAAPDRPGPPPRVAEVMSSMPVAGWPEADVADIARLMVERGVHSVPIVSDDEHVIGVVSRCDVLRTIMPTDEAAGREAQRRLDAYTGGERRWTVAVQDRAAVLSGASDDATERDIAAALVRTTAGIDTIRLAPA
ncbi:CBS domain-containing protein [Dactylosporangium sp. NBC_01737]|uniref:CBS domain-containing protein n=1 Tax=Dactylosporangium sp. NBC_01737 TaxID=2975959 RepID=UPI002E12180F|nr:CBS domain-containing protein [Dactylosporangium sp. NBC_01737]